VHRVFLTSLYLFLLGRTRLIPFHSKRSLLRRFNPLRTKCILLCIRTQFVPRSKHSESVIKTNLSTVFKENFTVCFESHTTQMQCNRHTKFLNGNPFQTSGLYTSTTRSNIRQFYVLPTQCICMFCVDLRTSSDYFTTLH
jgi:hypothetical protein